VVFRDAELAGLWAKFLGEQLQANSLLAFTSTHDPKTLVGELRERGRALMGFIATGQLPLSAWLAVGKDTLSAAALSQSVTLYLEPGYWGYVGSKATTISAAGQVTVNFGSVIENLIGGSGNDNLFGNAAANTITGGLGDDTISGGAGDDTLDGGAGTDTLDGGIGNDFIAGGAGNDVLTGGGGQDTFLFDVLTGSVDTITDYTPSDDVLQFASTGVFSGLTTTSGTLSANEFEFGAGLTSAATTAGRFVYNTTSGALYYDADGLSGTVAAVQIAVVVGAPELNHNEFFVI
jgi:Ca2+-binding RTX toxin-like protein